jgi:ABC-type branched-subunit amino acid transport system ATPase component
VTASAGPGGADPPGAARGPRGPDGAQPLLEVTGLRRSFAGVRAVVDVTFDVPQGSLYGLIGPNGAGKSTVMNIIAGSTGADGGTVRFRGRVINSLPDYRRARAGIIRAFQHSTEFGQMTVLESLLVANPDMTGQTYRSLLATRRRTWRAQEERAIHESLELLERVDLRRSANEYAAALSGGQKKLLELLRAISARPALLLLDEPFAGVHVRNTEAVCELLTKLRDDGVTILMTEHELGLVERLCSEAIVMARGSVIFRGSLAAGLQDREVVEAYVAG